MTTIGILGSGALGSNVARALANAGVSAMIANSRGPQSLQALIDETGPLIKPSRLKKRPVPMSC